MEGKFTVSQVAGLSLVLRRGICMQFNCKKTPKQTNHKTYFWHIGNGYFHQLDANITAEMSLSTYNSHQ